MINLPKTKTCSCCGVVHEAGKKIVAKPTVGGPALEGVIWFDCECGSTLIVITK